MNTERIIQLVTDAVTDAVRDALPRLIDAEVERAWAPHAQRLTDAERRVAALTASAANAEDLELTRADVRRLTEGHEAAQAALQAAVAARIQAEVSGAVAALSLPAGPAGEPGAPGRDGRDATFTPPVHWKAGAPFARGACVQHRGGLWYANQDSSTEPGEPLSGYSLILDGCIPDRCEAGPSGGLDLVFRFASGIEQRLSLGFRPMSYTGVFDATRRYEVNDLVTCEGSMWIARGATVGARPGTDQGALAWTLVVKRGKDGRDGLDGVQGPMGPQGEPGAPPAPKRKPSNGAAHD